MLAGDFSLQFPVELIEEDFGYGLDVAGSNDVAPTIAAARGVFRTSIANGWWREHDRPGVSIHEIEFVTLDQEDGHAVPEDFDGFA
ncbi:MULTISPECIES: hypothetical protein [Bradyrhizobium]|uniref:Uncharacterized protein n=1 Tax=Bradyrhizobium elkanii TaxID=29448 RepID=A0A4U6S2X5_BRAEL|nr:MULTISPECIES: hypothetical protein [Bradyrhizobium]MTV14093.1 hypothetical protein [Bradyrhizobium sp. BR2003]TKV80402.1 hypothetical protein FDV58_16660 [Bradyrhizobium elkanii]